MWMTVWKKPAPKIGQIVIKDGTKSSDFILLAHPAPLHNWSMLVVPRKHLESISDVDARQFSAMLQASIRALRRQFGVEPAFNIVVRAGNAIGHYARRDCAAHGREHSRGLGNRRP
jgi:diadenosine tetraphosphate (Ap4A) HIT family hydrolase